MKYRIVYNGHYYLVQYRYKFWPFWFNDKMPHYGERVNNVFNYKEGAIERMNYLKDMYERDNNKYREVKE